MGFAKQYLVEPNIDEMPTGFDVQNTELVDLIIALKDADMVLLLVDHNPFKALDLGMLTGKLVIDTRGIWASYA